jgi:pimeloyl-[acyl-carrier protein] methyl ester esterase
MGLHVEVSGQGEAVLLLHGWGMHGGVWEDVAARLAHEFTVHCVDLPGHGASELSGAFTLEHVVAQLDAQFTEPVNVVGWSLGGIIAQQWAAHAPQKIRRQVLVASTPCFANRADWHYGMPPETLALFASELEQNFSATLRRFLALQVRGSENERELLQRLREKLLSRGEPALAALRGGLAILRDADLRLLLPRLMLPTLVIAGERDQLTPPAASHYLADVLPRAKLVEIAGAAHAPFLSHAELFVEQLIPFLLIIV